MDFYLRIIGRSKPFVSLHLLGTGKVKEGSGWKKENELYLPQEYTQLLDKLKLCAISCIVH